MVSALSCFSQSERDSSLRLSRRTYRPHPEGSRVGAGVSKDGSTLRACGHGSRRPPSPREVRAPHHEGCQIGFNPLGAGGVLGRIAAARDVDHRRHVELDHRLVERIPPLVGERRRVEVAAGRIGIEVAADEQIAKQASLVDCSRTFLSLQFMLCSSQRESRRSRNLSAP
jgi:hypothetical protein